MRALALLLALLVGAPALAQAPAPSPAPPPLPDPAEPAPVDLSVTLTPKDEPSPDAPPDRPLEVHLGDPLVLALTARAARDTELFPPLLPAVGTFELGAALPGTDKVDGERREITWRWTVLPVRTGAEKIPAIELPYRTREGVEGSVSSPIVRVLVRGHLENEVDPALGKAPPPVDVITTNWALVWALSVGGALVFAALGTWLVLLALRQRFEALRPPPPPRPAIEVALERLDAIDGKRGDELDGAARLAATIDALREYLGTRYRVDALEMTSRELALALENADLKTIAPAEIEALLADADLVKFARIVPPEATAREKSPIVRRIVTETWEPPAQETPEVIRREPASVRQRVYAGAIDGLLAGTLGLMLFGFLWIVGAIELGFLGLALIGALLALRDAFGRSPGKVMLRLDLALRDEAQGAPQLARRVRRNALFLVWPLTVPLEWLVLRQHPLGLRVGDMWADTEVVRAGPAPGAAATLAEVAR